jgi:hypothetical protein
MGSSQDAALAAEIVKGSPQNAALAAEIRIPVAKAIFQNSHPNYPGG